MKYVFFFSLLLLSCARNEQENPLKLLGGGENNKEVLESFAEIPIETPVFFEEEKEKFEEKKETPKIREVREEIPISAPTQRAQTTQTQQRRTRRDTVTQEKVREVNLFIFDDKFRPLTREDARNFAFECYKLSTRMLNTNIDSARIVSLKGLSIFENSSLHYLSARGLAAAGNFSLAANHCRTALSRNDFWGNEREATIRLLVEILQKMHERNPSTLLSSQIERYKEMLR